MTYKGGFYWFVVEEDGEEQYRNLEAVSGPDRKVGKETTYYKKATPEEVTVDLMINAMNETAHDTDCCDAEFGHIVREMVEAFGEEPTKVFWFDFIEKHGVTGITYSFWC